MKPSEFTRAKTYNMQIESQCSLDDFTGIQRLGKLGQAEINLLTKKLNVVVRAFGAERRKNENDLSKASSTPSRSKIW